MNLHKESHQDQEQMPKDEQENKHGPPSMWSLVGSILGAAFGVQSSRVRERDFSQRSPLPFIIGGLIFGVLFVTTLVVIVSVVLPD